MGSTDSAAHIGTWLQQGMPADDSLAIAGGSRRP